MPKTLTVKLGKRSYDIIVGARVLADAGRIIAPLLKNERVIVISDELVAKLYLHRLSTALAEHGISCQPVMIEAGESSKSLEDFGYLLENIFEHKPDRNTTLIALGGGVVGDVTGFAASVLLRGIDFIQIPTTLLAQVDSSVGGKTGVNSRYGKNLIGTFHQPRLVLSDVSTLATLPEREIKAGYAEIVKYGLISDKKFFAWLERYGKGLLAGDAAVATEAIIRSCKAKAAIVAKDECESGLRALLNFGHTFAHALEAETGYGEALLHGEAVAIGMILAFKTSVAMGLCPKSDLDRVLMHYKTMSLPHSLTAAHSQWDIARLMEHFERDKKAAGGQLTFILTHGIGKAFIAKDVDKSVVQRVLVEACTTM